MTSVSRARIAISRTALRVIAASPWLWRRIGRSRSAPVDGRVLDPDLAALLGLDDVQHGSDLRGLSPTEARLRMIESIAIVEAPAPSGVVTREIMAPGPAGPIPLRMYVPDGLGAPSPGVVFVHGGGFVTCDRDTHDVFCRRIALGARCRVVSVEYRLAPEHPFPAAVDDGLAAYFWIADHAADLGMDPKRLAVAGDSAGGNLSAVVARRAAKDPRAPALHVPIYPAVDATAASPSHAKLGGRYLLTSAMIDWYYERYLESPAEKKNPDVSPLLAEDLTGIAPALVYTAGFDPLRDEGRAYADKLEAAGVRVRYRCFDTMAHGFALMTGVVPAARLAVEAIADDIGKELWR